MSKGRLRPMHSADLARVLRWRNHPDVRRFMYTSHEISQEEHAQWFARNSQTPGVWLLIYEVDTVPLGFVNISSTRCSQIADWGFYLAADAETGTGRSLGATALEFAFAELKLHKLCGQALGFNERSIRFHERLGFSREGVLREQHFDGECYQDVICFGLLAADWKNAK